MEGDLAPARGETSVASLDRCLRNLRALCLGTLAEVDLGPSVSERPFHP